jgi:hypothetical protein
VFTTFGAAEELTIESLTIVLFAAGPRRPTQPFNHLGPARIRAAKSCAAKDDS